MLPLWRTSLHEADVTDGTYSSTFSAFYALLGINAERAIADYPFSESFAYEPAVDAWPSAYGNVADACLVAFYVSDEILETAVSLGLLPAFRFSFVHVHERHTHIRFGHEQRYAAVRLYAHSCKVGFEDVHCLTDCITCCAYGIAIVVGCLADA